MTKVFRVLPIMACTSGDVQPKQSYSIGDVSNFQAMSKQRPSNVQLSSRHVSSPLDVSCLVVCCRLASPCLVSSHLISAQRLWSRPALHELVDTGMGDSGMCNYAHWYGRRWDGRWRYGQCRNSLRWYGQCWYGQCRYSGKAGVVIPVWPMHV